jgi:putative oxidoreductase
VCPYSPDEGTLQRLFSSFADGWPGFGLFIQRMVTGLVLFYNAIAPLKDMAAAGGLAVPEIAGAVLGLFILAGLWTPLVGTLIAVAEVWVLLAGGSHPEVSILLAVLGGTLAMIGPGAWSIDARLFGRKYIPF